MIWSKKYPLDERGIPQFYVVRTDGKQWCTGVGSLPGDQLPAMLLSVLGKSSRNFADDEAQVLSDADNQSVVSAATRQRPGTVRTARGLTVNGSQMQNG